MTKHTLPTVVLTLLLAACGGGGGGSTTSVVPGAPAMVVAPNSFTVRATFDCTATGCTSATPAAVIATGKTLALSNVSDVGCDGHLTDGAAFLAVLDANGTMIQSFGAPDNGNGSSATYNAVRPGSWTLAGSPEACFAALHGATGTKTQTITGTYAAGP